MAEENIGKAVVESIKSADLASLAGEYAEIGIDAVLSEGVLRDIPIVGTITALGKLGASINDRIFTKKIVRFLISLAAISEQDRLALIEKLNEEDEFRNKVGERVIEILDRIDSQRKPEMVASVFKAYAEELIDGNTLRRLNHTIERIPAYDITFVRKFAEATAEARIEIPNIILNQLAMAGLANPVSAWDGMVFVPTEICEKFLELNLDK
jgi:hypothetical protein